MIFRLVLVGEKNGDLSSDFSRLWPVLSVG